eukprot:gene1085-1375_t
MSDDEDDKQPGVVLTEDKGFISFYNNLDYNDKDLIRFFERKGYYSLHGEEAKCVALLHFKSLKSLKYWNGNDSKSSSTPAKKKMKTSSSPPTTTTTTTTSTNSTQQQGFANLTIREGIEFETIIQKLFEEKKKIEIWGMKSNRVNDWELIRRGSPGNIQKFEDILTTSGDRSMMMAMKLASEGGNRILGVAFGDATFKKLGLSQFIDNDHLSNFSSFLVQMGIKECLIHIDPKNHDYAKVVEKLEEAGIPYTNVQKSDFSSKSVEQDLTRLLGSITNNLPELESEHAMQSIACLIKHLDLLSNQNYFGKFKLERFDLDSYMRLDASVLKGLHIVDSSDANRRGMSLYGLLNKCNTSMGSRLLMQWIKQPLINTEEIETRLNFVQAFIDDLELRQSLRSNDLKKICDLERLSKRLSGGQSNLEDCVTLYGNVKSLPTLLNSLKNYAGEFQELITANFTDNLANIIDEFQKFTAMVETTIDLELAFDSHEFVIRSSFSEDLAKIQTKKNQIYNKIESIRKDIASDLDLDESKLKLHPDKKTFLFRLSRKDEPTIRGKSKYIVDSTQKDGVRFHTKELATLNENYQKLSIMYDERQEELVKRALQIAASFVPLIEDLSSLIGTLDVFVSLAHVSSTATIPYVRPTINPMGTGDTIMTEGRHPFVEFQDGVNFIPNDISLIRGKSQFHIITGPNMGGKSTFIRQVGLITLMAQIGCFVPCTEATISVVDCILSRVGAGDSQLRGVSTFMAEMLETSYILKVATKNSLIIIDELGRGTSTYDGFGLAWGIIDYICNNIGASCLFATHFHELTVLSDLIPVVNNLHVSARTENNQLTLLYKVREGSCDQSFGIHVAILANFPQEVIDVAKLKAKELENFESQSLKQNNYQFLEEFKQIDLDSIEPDQAIQTVHNLLNKYSIDINNH